MQQLIFNLFPPPPPTFENYLVGNNEELISALKTFLDTHIQGVANPVMSTMSLHLWGATGVGKSHLLAAAADYAQKRAYPIHLVVPGALPALSQNQPPALWLVDDIEAANEETQAFLFTLYNLLRELGGALLTAALLPPSQLLLRSDTRTRLGWGVVYEVTRLDDDQKTRALIDYARTRGLILTIDIIRYLLKTTKRDMRSLTVILDALDRYSLTLKRPLTLPLVRAWLQEQAMKGSIDC
ncbi:MAG: DnaA regulatory inactivator Hda [Burkholderiales bacterium]|jgi:DnaA family protein|nr:DnaA regulatory inactivator Hda [Burkholderiales bacterium]